MGYLWATSIPLVRIDQKKASRYTNRKIYFLKKIIVQSIAVLTPREKQRFWFFIAVTVIINLADIASLALLLYILSLYAHSITPQQLPWLPEQLFTLQPSLLLGIFLGLFIIKNMAAYLVNRGQYHFVYSVASRISRNNVVAYLQGSYMDYVNKDSAEQIRAISLQPLEFCQYVLIGIQQVITETILILFTITAILLFNSHLFFLLLIVLLPPVLTTAWLTRRKLETARAQTKQSLTKVWQHLHEAVGGFIESNIYRRNAYFSQQYITAQHTLNMHQSQQQAIQGIPARLTEVFAVFGLLVLVITGTQTDGTHATAEIITLGAFMAAAYKIIPGIARIMNISGQVRSHAFTIDRLLTGGGATHSSTQRTTPLQSIVCSNLGITRHSNGLLSGLYLSIQPGDMLGISTPSGMGKTTFINTLLGFLEPAQGEILFNSEVTTSRQRQQYWAQVAYVKQQPFLLHDTVLANIILGAEEYDKQRLQEALDATGLTHIITQWPEGLQHVIAENGRNISGGQRQRIVIARALYANANLLVLDEPFSELDEKAETTLLTYCRQLANAGKMVILVTHNKRSLAFCNKIITEEAVTGSTFPVTGYLLIAALLPVTRLLGITLRRNHTQEEPPQHLLFIKLLGLGSLVLATDAIAAIRKQWPDTKLILLTDTNIAAGIAPFELFDEIWTIPSGNLFRTFAQAFRHLVHTWKLKHLWVADLEVYSKLTTVYSLLTMANNRFGFYLSPVLFRKHLNTHNILFNRTGFLEDNYRQMAKAITGIATIYRQPVPVREQEYQKPFIILNNTCSGLAPVRKLPDETFAAVCRWLLESTHYQLALSGTPADKEEIDTFIVRYFNLDHHRHRIVNIAVRPCILHAGWGCLRFLFGDQHNPIITWKYEEEKKKDICIVTCLWPALPVCTITNNCLVAVITIV
ncbi:hypothetical protein F5148DRAFT_1307837 [Russula earlei]|uniref:Uncharacterized protein n=1 Tax=Russula earlei TaxID=71964 RepID=A0ACC0TQU7_9AGAM|nr:hypothetical protein F5148DRAFT_1307837 [Russula earlei]